MQTRKILLELNAHVERLIRDLEADPSMVTYDQDKRQLDMEERERVHRLYAQIKVYERVHVLIDLKLEQVKDLEHDAMHWPW